MHFLAFCIITTTSPTERAFIIRHIATHWASLCDLDLVTFVSTQYFHLKCFIHVIDSIKGGMIECRKEPSKHCNKCDLPRVCEWLLFDVKLAMFQPYHGENKLHFDEIMMSSLYYKHTNTPSWILIVLVHPNNNPRVDMSLHSDTLFWFRDNQSLVLSLSGAWESTNNNFSL